MPGGTPSVPGGTPSVPGGTPSVPGQTQGTMIFNRSLPSHMSIVAMSLYCLCIMPNNKHPALLLSKNYVIITASV